MKKKKDTIKPGYLEMLINLRKDVQELSWRKLKNLNKFRKILCSRAELYQSFPK